MRGFRPTDPISCQPHSAYCADLDSNQNFGVQSAAGLAITPSGTARAEDSRLPDMEPTDPTSRARPRGQTRKLVAVLLRVGADGLRSCCTAWRFGAHGLSTTRASSASRLRARSASRRYDWAAVQRYYDEGHSITPSASQHFGFASKRSGTRRGPRRGCQLGRRLLPMDELLVAGRRRSRTHGRPGCYRAGSKENRCDRMRDHRMAGRADRPCSCITSTAMATTIVWPTIRSSVPQLP